MGFRELIKKVQIESGFSDQESKESLEHMVESLAVHLDEGERKDFASQLPEELQDIALAVMPTEETARQDMLEQFMENQHVSADRAKKQMLSAWHAIRAAVSEGELDHVMAQLPNKTVAMLR
ncbi:MAG TPA: DUF2267 domain-containing protein [Candidatus Saccharimonadales bacterium]|nr:DUF2267 domain-containing protein [Candidatus Saccharimonadales bacterium]